MKGRQGLKPTPFATICRYGQGARVVDEEGFSASSRTKASVALAEVLQAGSVLHDDSPRLADGALDHFYPDVVIERLLAPEPTYFAYHYILFSGLTAWTAAPQSPHLVKEAMILAGMPRLAAVPPILFTEAG